MSRLFALSAAQVVVNAWEMRYSLLLISLAGVLAGCSSGKYQLELMHTPAVYEDGSIDRLSADPPAEVLTYPGMLYATNRVLAEGEGANDVFYTEVGSGAVRVGVAEVNLVGEEMSWEEVREISLSEDRELDLVIEVESVNDLGILANSRHPFLPDEAKQAPAADAAFAGLINGQLAHTQDQELFVFVHGYRVPFDDPVLVATEFWYFMGFDGVAIAFSWPSTPSLIAYLRDTEASTNAAREFRKFLQFLSEETNATKVNVLAFSAGTRMVADALHEIALEDEGLNLGQIILVSSDVSNAKIGAMIADGALDKLDYLTIYTSTSDMALAFTNWLFDRERIGGHRGENVRLASAVEFLNANPKLQLIDVSEAEGATQGDGHGYFRSSPWASSDILASLDFHLTPAERGLVWNPDTGEWSFPPDYLERLRAAIRAKIGQ